MQQLSYHGNISLHLWLSPLHESVVETSDGLITLDSDQRGHEEGSADVDVAGPTDSRGLVD